jgi:hypothetical protein
MQRRLAIVAAFCAALFSSACSKSSSNKSDAGTPNTNCGVDRACLTGVVTTAATVNDPTPVGIADAKVSLADGTLLGTANQQGWYFVKNVPVGAGVPICFEAAGFARRCRNVGAAAGQNVQVSNTGLLGQNAFTGTVAAGAGGTIVLDGATQLTFPANAACLASGAAPTGTVECALTPIVAADEAQRQLAPGNYRGTQTGGAESQLVTGGMMEIVCRDSSTQARVNVCSGKTVTVRFPVDAATCANAALHPDTMKSWGFDEVSGLWKEYGTFAKTCGADSYYEGEVNHFSYWNADNPIQTTCATGHVLDTAGAPVQGALVTCDGDTSQSNGYQGPSEAYTGADGAFCIPVKVGSAFRCIARKGAFVSAPKTGLTSGGSAAACGSASCTAIGDFALTDPLIRIVLTWGLTPHDLDSHLVGADYAALGGTHTWYGEQGSLVAAPFVELDTDDVDSYGPEITSFVHGAKAQRYRFCVHDFSGEAAINASSAAATVDAFLGGDHVRVTVPTTATSLELWRVLEFTLDAAGNAGGVRVINDLVDPNATSIEQACMQ